MTFLDKREPLTHGRSIATWPLLMSHAWLSCFAGVLYALDDDDELPWRRAGDSWEPPRYEEGQAPVYSMSDIAAQIEMSARCVSTATSVALVNASAAAS